MWGIKVFFPYALRRVDCGSCGVKVEAVPWAQGKSPLTTTYAWFLARWAKRLKLEGDRGGLSRQLAQCRAVREDGCGLGLGTPANLNGVSAIGVDEIARGRGQKYATLVYQIDAGAKRLLWVGRDRTEKTLLRFFDWFGEKQSVALRFVCTDMWKPYLQIIAWKAAQAVHVLDRFHIMSHMSKAIDAVRAKEVKELKAKGKNPVLTGTR